MDEIVNVIGQFVLHIRINEFGWISFFEI